MFSFHKPKIYRSMQGCCICRAKSSSSRFTDSKRYENDFIKCFEIMERRSGEICNACVLLVKRWKKLPVGSNRNWHHVVDARAGPGTKSMNKIKNKAKLEEKLLKKKHKHKHKKPTTSIKPVSSSSTSTAAAAATCRSSGGLSDDVADYYSEHSSQSGDFLSNSDGSEDERSSRSRGKDGKRRKPSNPLQYSSFLDLNYWKKTEVCCGVIFKGPHGDVVIDMSLMHPCKNCTKQPAEESAVVAAAATAATDELLSNAGSATPAKTEEDDTPTAAEENDAADMEEEEEEEEEDDDLLDDLEEEEEDADIVEELDLDEDLIGGNMDDLEDEEEDEGTDSGMGSQEISNAEGSPPHPGPPLQTAAAMLHAMSTGADLMHSSVAAADGKNTAAVITAAAAAAAAAAASSTGRSRHFSGEQRPSAAAHSLPSSLHSVVTSLPPPPPPSVLSAVVPRCVQMQMEV